MRVLVIGAGPAGAAAAIALARGGAFVRVVEKSRFPRAKTCGDGISPPGVREALELGVSFASERRLELGEIATPGGVRFTSGWRKETPWGAIVPRIDFDARLMRLAVAAGAVFDDGVAVRDVVAGRAEPPRVTFAATVGTQTFDAIVLADGATGTIATRLGFGRHRQRLVALRGYADAVRPLPAQFGLYFDRGVSPGYGWIFPVDERRANVGVLVDERAVRRRAGDMRAILRDWMATNAAAQASLGSNATIEARAGGVIPTGRRRRVRDRVFLVGDAAGVADPFSAEGIYQAMATGRAVAVALLRHGPTRAAERAYRRALRPFDRNAAEANRLRLGFHFVIDAMARRALVRPNLAHHLSANGFFMKESLPAFLWGIARNW